MNRTYKIIWNAARQVWMAVGELTKAHGKSKSQASAQVSSKATTAIGAALLATGLSLTAAPVLADEWNAGTGDWVTNSNWVDGTAPTSSDDVTIDNGGTAQVTTTGQVSRVVYLGTTDGGSGTLDITSAGALASNNGQVGNGINSTGTATVEGDWTISNVIYMGVNDGSNGTLTISNGGAVSSTYGSIGTYSGSTGTVTVDGSSSTWTNGNTLNVGEGGTGILTISNGGAVSNALGFIGNSSGSTGAVTVDGAGSSWTNGSNLGVGYSGSGTLTISNGGAVSNALGSIGHNSGSTGTVTVDGSGSSWTNGSILNVGFSGSGTLTISNGGAVSNTTGFIGYNSGSTGTATVDGRGSTWTSSGDLYLGYSGAGTLTLSNGGAVSGAGTVYVAGVATGTLNIGAAQDDTAIAAGTLNAAAVAFGGGTGKLVFNHTETAYDFAPDITGAGAIGLYGGTTRFTGSLGGHTGTLTVASGGTLSVADGETLTLGGSYVQSGVLSIGASSSSSYGKVNVAGTATLDSGASFNVNVAGVNTLSNGNVLSGVLASSGTLTNNAGTLTVTDNSTLFDFTARINGNDIDLLTSAASSSGVLTSVINQGFTAGTGAATVLDGFVNGGTTGGDMDNIVTALGQLSGDQAVANAVAQTLPLMTAGMTQVASSNMHATNRVVQARQEGSHGISSGDEALSNKHLWVKTVGSWARQSDRNSVSGYKAGSYGIISGADGELDSANRVGVAFSYMHSSVDGNAGSNHANIDAYQAIAYGSHTLAAMPDTELSWQADIGRNNNKGSRIINFGGLDRVASASYHSTTAHVGAGLARNIVLDDSTTVTPAIRADYTYIRDQSYTETGAGGLNLNVNSHSDDEFILLGEGRVSHKLSDKTTLVANAGIGYDVLHGTSSVTASYVGGGAAFTTQGLQASPWLGRVGVGLVSNLNSSTELSVRYDAEVRSGYVDQTASVKVRWAF